MWRLPTGLLLIALVTAPVFGQQTEGLITGKITSDQGAPIADAQVAIDNMGLRTVTKADGSYRIVVPAARATGQAAMLSVRLLGYRPKSLAIVLNPIAQTIDVVLPPQAVVLQQVVITGEGIITTNEKLGETVNTVQGEALTSSDESNVVNALSGKAANVQVQSQSGDPGSSTSVQIRGMKSFSGDGQPLFVVDGVPIDNSTLPNYDPYGDVVAPNRIADVNPNDIESVTILKGAAASAIYGARASQGVVLITTKRGTAGVTRYSLRASYSATDVTQGYPLQTSFGQGFSCTVVNCIARGTEAATWGAALAAGTPVYDHFGEMFETGSIWDVMLSVSGGDDRRSFYFSGGYTANQGFVVGPNDSYDRVTINLKASQMLADRVQLSAKMSYVNTNGSYVQRGNNLDGIMLDGMRTPPEFNNFYYLDSTYGMHRAYRFPNPDPSSLKRSRGYNNPIFSIYEEPSTSALERFYGNLDVNWQASDWLTVQWTPGLDYYTDARYGGIPFTATTFEGLGGAFQEDYKNLIVSSVITLVGSHVFNPDLSGSITLGNEINSSSLITNFVAGDDLVTPQPLRVWNVQVPFVPYETQQIIHRQSYFGQVTGDLYDQLYLTLAIRNDGYSTFAQNDPRAWYPKASAAWTFTKSMHLSGHGALQYGKVRVAYGETGKEPLPYSTLNNYVTAAFGGGLTSSPALGNSNLAPERQAELEGGFDLGFFDGLADLSASAYSSKANNVILAVPLPASSGGFTQIQNGASMKNAGLEVQLNLNSPKSSRVVQWSVGLLWGQNRNEVLALTNGVTQVLVGTGGFDVATAVAQVGYPAGSLSGIDFARCGNGAVVDTGGTTPVPLDGLSYCAAGSRKGALYIGADGFPVVDPTPRILGSPQPDWAGAVSASVTFRQKWQLSVLVDVRHGGQAWNGTKGGLYYFGTHKDTEIRGQSRTFGTDFFAGPRRRPRRRHAR